MLLVGPTPQRLLGVLADADRILDGLRAEAQSWRASMPVAAGPAAVGPRPFDPAPAPGETRKRRSSWSIGSMLLALGAVCLVVAAFIFVSVSWGTLGLAGRTAVLAAVTLAFAGAATAVTVRRLRASAEALWAVTLAMLALDYAGAYSYGLLGLGSLSAAGALLVFGVGFGSAAVAMSAWVRRTFELRITAGEIATCIGLTAFVAGAIVLAPAGDTWTVLGLVLPMFACAAAIRPLRLGFPMWYAAGLGAVLQAASALSIATDVLAYESLSELFGGLGVLPTVAVAAQTVLVGIGVEAFVRRRGDAELATLTAYATTAVALLQLLVPAYAVVLDDVQQTQLVAAGVTIGLAVVGIGARGRWLQGVRIAGGVTAVPLVWFGIAWCAAALTSLEQSMNPVWSEGVWAVLRPTDPGLGSGLLAGVALEALAVSMLAGAYYSEVKCVAANRRRLLIGAVALGIAGLIVPMCLVATPVVVVAAALIGAGCVLAGAPDVRCEAIGLVVIVAAAPVALVSESASVVVWLLICAATAGVGARTSDSLIRSAAAAVSIAFAQATVVGVVHLSGADDRLVHLSLVLAVCVTLVAAQYVRPAELRRTAESVATGGAVLSVVSGLVLPLGWQSVMLTMLGAAVTGVSLLRSDRRRFALPGSALLGLAYVLRLLASDISVVEAYTLPFATVLLAVGYVRMRAVPQLRTRVALTPGLSLALLPSLPAVLIDPTTLRGLLLGFAACGVLAVGVRMRWQAPFVAGTTLAMVIVVRHLGPYTDAVPRWVLIAAAGVVLLAVGVTWESRVRNARAAASYVETMR